MHRSKHVITSPVPFDAMPWQDLSLLNPYVAGRNDSFLIIGYLRCNVGQQNQTKKIKSIVPSGRVESKILVLRGETVILDKDLAELYGVKTSRLNQQVRRNIERFPEDFAFLLSNEEFRALKSHFATSSATWGGRRKPPIAFTEHGALMAANILKTQVAVQASIQVVRTFVRLRTMIATHNELSEKLKTLEQKYDQQFNVVFDAIRELMKVPDKASRRIGFHAGDD
jgi:hypothetical protein